MQAAKPDLVHVSVNAFGTGPLGHDRPGYDALVQAFTGIMAMTGEPGGNPVRAAPSIIDISTGLWAALAVCAVRWFTRRPWVVLVLPVVAVVVWLLALTLGEQLLGWQA